MNPVLRQRVLSAFANAFGGAPARLFSAPGRVNLIGEHTDYNDGFVLPCAIDMATAVAARASGDARLVAASADYGEIDAFALETPISRSKLAWANYVRGVAAMLTEDGHAVVGAELAIAGDVPQGAGLSSSASLEVAVTLALSALSGLDLDPTEMAQLARRAENDFVGCACGIMDQLVATRAEAGHALMIDCRSLECRPVPLPPGAAIVIVHSGVRHANAEGAYNERRSQCEAAARHYRVAALRDLDVERLDRDSAGLDPLLFRRARHVVTENARVIAAARALAAGDLSSMGRLMRESHVSMRDDFEITVPAVDRLAEIMNDALGEAGGARMTGGGFGGCVVALAPAARADQLREHLRTQFRTPEGLPSNLYVCTASGAADEYPSSG